MQAKLIITCQVFITLLQPKNSIAPRSPFRFASPASGISAIKIIAQVLIFEI